MNECGKAVENTATIQQGGFPASMMQTCSSFLQDNAVQLSILVQNQKSYKYKVVLKNLRGGRTVNMRDEPKIKVDFALGSNVMLPVWMASQLTPKITLIRF